MKKTICCALVLVSACATPYHGGVLGESAKADWQSEDTLTVTARGNAYTSAENVNDYNALKAAEEAINAGYRYIVRTKTVNVSENATHYVRGHAREGVGAPSYGDRSTRSGEADPPFGEKILVHKPGQRTTYKCYKEPPEGMAREGYEDAYETYNALGQKHKKDFEPVEF